ncbi:MAG: PQQ-binding-like beta-propeller repeat protein [Verrucomicrobiae bacterium]|nr:PQQ-binding-like beta-propeller repeat protein [Verrucomicrobiae bacterium]
MKRSSFALPALALGLACPTLLAADWPNYRGPNHDGISTEKLVATSWPASGPRTLWRVPTPDGFSSFTVANGRAFTLVNREIDGVTRETVVALDAATGQELWAFPMAVPAYGHDGGNAGTPDNSGGDGPRSTPTLDGNRVYALDSRLLLVCLDVATGEPVWRKNVLREYGGRVITWGGAASPVIEGHRIFVATASSEEGQSMIAVDKNSGETLWKSGDDKMTHATPVVATLHGQRQVIFFTQAGLTALHPDTGAILWQQEHPFRISTAASPIVVGDLVYASAAYERGAGLYRIGRDGSRFTSTTVWMKPNALMNHWSTPVHHDGHLYGLFGHANYGRNPLQCIELATGEIKWSQDGFGPGNVTLVDGHLIVLGDAGQLVLAEASPAAYREKARANVVSGKCWTTPTYAGGLLYVRSTVEGVCLDLRPQVAAR